MREQQIKKKLNQLSLVDLHVLAQEFKRPYKKDKQSQISSFFNTNQRGGRGGFTDQEKYEMGIPVNQMERIFVKNSNTNETLVFGEIILLETDGQYYPQGEYFVAFDDDQRPLITITDDGNILDFPYKDDPRLEEKVSLLYELILFSNLDNLRMEVEDDHPIDIIERMGFRKIPNSAYYQIERSNQIERLNQL